MKKAEFVKEIESIYNTQQSKIINGFMFIDKEDELLRWIEVDMYDDEVDDWVETDNFFYLGYKIKPCGAKTLANKIWNYYNEDDWQGAYRG